jgi:peroxiredoxin
MPELQELSERYGDDLVVVGVSIDRAGADESIRAFLDEVGVDFPVLLDPRERFVHRFMTLGVPETFLIDADGVVRWRWTGRYHPLAAENLELVEDALADAG